MILQGGARYTRWELTDMATENLTDNAPYSGARPLGASSLQTPLPQDAQRALTFGLLLSAARCTLQYILLPFVLPLIGFTGKLPPWLTLVLGLVALVFLARNVRRLWRMRHARRWSYLFLALVVGGTLILFAALDLHALVRI